MTKQEKKENEKYLTHEALDRTHVILCNIDDFLLDHKLFNKKQNKKLLKKIEKASKLLSDVYQSVGKIEFDKFNQ